MSDDIKKSRPKILDDLDKVAAILPVPIYWEDTNSVILGGNEAVFKGTGAQIREAYVGKTLYELYPHDMAEHIKSHNEEVMRTGEILSQEEPIEDITTGAVKYFTAVKAPLYDDDGNTIGIVGTSLDITAKKEAERLKFENLHLENEMQRQLLAEHEKYTQLATQVAHDIRSPLAALNTALKLLSQLPEQERIILRNAVQRINDIANNLLIQYKHRDLVSEANERRLLPWLIVPIIDSMATEKRLQFENSSIEIETHYNNAAYCAFVKLELIEIKRVLSNLVNNAVESFLNKRGKICITVNATLDTIIIDVKDNGSGIAAEKLPKIFADKLTTKKEGYGMGLAHAKRTIENMSGNIAISSILGEGTTVTVNLPQTIKPAWFMPEIVISPEDQIIVLDDDESIHGAWDSRLQSISLKHPVLHFRKGSEFIRWRKVNQDKIIFVLSDYELLGEEKSGLDILEELKIRNKGVVITSHYERADIVERCIAQEIALLPKNLVAHIPIRINTAVKHSQQYDAILLDDDLLVTSTWLYCAELAGKNLAIFNHVSELEAVLIKFPHGTPIYLDSHLSNNVKGEEYAKLLYERGFKTIYLVTGYPPEHFPPMPWITKILGKKPEFF